MKTKIRTLGLFASIQQTAFVIAIGLFVMVGSAQCDEYSDEQDIKKAAQQLKDLDDAHRAAAQKRYEAEHPQSDGLGAGGYAVLAALCVTGYHIIKVATKSEKR